MENKAINKLKQEYEISIKVKIILIILPIAMFFISFCFGRYNVSPLTVIKLFAYKVFGIASNISEVEEAVIINLRLPRIILGMLVGSGLSISGAALQGMFGNPLVSPQVMGVSAGAGFGAALAILLFGNVFAIQSFAVIMGIVAIAITYSISQSKKGESSVYMLVLAGVITSAFFEALISAIKFVADPFSKLPTITYWLMGSLSSASMKDVIMVSPMILIGIITLLVFRWRINILSLDEDEAKSLGVNLKASRIVVIMACTLITASSVSACGIVGWIGLVIPHVCRMIVGPNHKNLIPACISVGSVYLLIIDNIARSVSSVEIPLSILTAIIGVPFFAYLLKRSGGQWS